MSYGGIDVRLIWLFLGIVFLYFALQVTGWFSTIFSIFATIPWWVFFVAAGIIFSGYKAVQGMLEDRRVDQKHIEQEGQVYLERIEEEKQKRKGVSG